MALEVGKNRMESLGDVQETADLMYYSAQMMEEKQRLHQTDGKGSSHGYDSTNTSILRPYGVWLIISPFNFPFALTGGQRRERSWLETRSSSSLHQILPGSFDSTLNVCATLASRTASSTL
jgi:hypothetical protein